MVDMKHPAPASRYLRFFALVILGGLLLWLVITRSLVAWLAEKAPETALLLRSKAPIALTNLADAAIKAKLSHHNKKTQQSPHDSDKTNPPLPNDQQIRAWARQALREAPLNARAWRILGQLAEKNADMVQAEKFMQVAANMSLRETPAVYWLMLKAYQRQDHPLLLRYADALLRHRPQLTKYVTLMLASLAENPNGRAKLEALLAQNPPWRQRFFSALPAAVTNARTPLKLLLGLRTTQAPPTARELGAYLAFLQRQKLYNLAYYTWLQFLPAEQLARTGFLFNGSFEWPADRLPFNWTIHKGSGVTIDMAPRPDNPAKQALYVELSGGRVHFPGIWQTVVLAPGHYQLTGRYQGTLTGPRGLRWRVHCLGGRHATRLGETAMFIGETRIWKRFEITFKVPLKDCPAQRIGLILDARTASEKLVSGALWYDDLKLTPKFEQPSE